MYLIFVETMNFLLLKLLICIITILIFAVYSLFRCVHLLDCTLRVFPIALLPFILGTLTTFFTSYSTVKSLSSRQAPWYSSMALDASLASSQVTVAEPKNCPKLFLSNLHSLSLPNFSNSFYNFMIRFQPDSFIQCVYP